ncbi:hypothetical protein EDD37DRAFT_654080 [Exophiala viscosa]|uniref:uncharacterized protein n=1 Tax=Exophiala viscosa TaxID=2486360 RepID=UPI0021934362|nr:hypothetical protein EDD37DRAFT_654080 [Exophiala viscosa]
MPLLRVNNPARRTACTHMTMTRLFDPIGSFKCSICSKHPSIGWLYRCTQDSDSFLPETDFTGQPSNTKKRNCNDVAAHSLSASIIEAIGQGQYTDEQIRSLMDQKEKVRHLILAQESRPPTASTSSTATASSFEGSLSTLPQSTTFSTTSSTSLDEEIKAAYDWKELQKVWMSEPSIPPPECETKRILPVIPTLDSRLLSPQPCEFMVCPTCRPTYRERAYQPLEAILNSPVQFPPPWELENRRVSDARVLAEITLPEHSGTDFSMGDTRRQSLLSPPNIVVHEAENMEAPQHSGDVHSVRKRSGFRQTVRKALARARTENTFPQMFNDLPDHDNNPDSSRQSRSLISRRRRSRATLSFVQTHGRVVDTSSLQDSVTLMVATNTPLPHTPTVSTSHAAGAQNQDLQQHLGTIDTGIADVIAQA